MKYCTLLILIFSLIYSPTYGENKLDLSCFSHTLKYNNIQEDGRFIVDTPSRNFIALQGDTPLEIQSLEKAYRYIDFQTNIPQEKNTESDYKYLYNFNDLDTRDTKEILITIPKLQTEDFSFIFRHDSRYHDARYEISEDGESFSEVAYEDVSDFVPQKIRITFTNKYTHKKEEKIQIQHLEIKRNNPVSSIYLTDTSAIDLYLYNRCDNSAKGIGAINRYFEEKDVVSLIKFENNFSYMQKNTDTDKDGINDMDDNCPFTKNRNQDDVNIDGIGDACQYDIDDDGVYDSIDNCRNTPNPDQKDDDNDAIGNACDNCKLYNPKQVDKDNSKVGDVCEDAKNYIALNDDDKDGIHDRRGDNCPLVYNPNQKDTDDDGKGDACDNCPNIRNNQQIDLNKNGVGDMCEDSDNDGIEGHRDNCFSLANPDQADQNNDGIGDVCEDTDRDDIFFIEDNCPYKYNPDQKDIDKDKIGDECDEKDNRLLESNNLIFIILILILIGVFGFAIYSMYQKIEK